jgi:DNA-binding transcriptional LysR family regulator
MRQGLKEIEFLTDPDAGELRIGCPEAVIAGFLPPILERFSRQYPRIRLNVVHANTALLQFQELRERNVELLIGRTQSPLLDDDLVLETLFEEPFVAVAGYQSKWARRRRIELADLIAEPWVLPPYDSAPGSLIFDIFRASDLQPPLPQFVTLSVQLTTTLVGTGRYVGLLPSSVSKFGSGRETLKRHPLKLAPRSVPMNVITVRNRTLSPLAKLFIDCARDVAKPDAAHAK